MGRTAKTPTTDRLYVTDREVFRPTDAATGTGANKESDRCLLLLAGTGIGPPKSAACRSILSIRKAVCSTSSGSSAVYRHRTLYLPNESRAVNTWLKARVQMKLPAEAKIFFVSEQRRPPDRSRVNYLLKTASATASVPFIAHPHGKVCALITDGRFSGGSSGLSIGHISPEAAEGGALALVEEGDRIAIDIPERSIRLCVSVEELARRRAAIRAYAPSARTRKVSPALQAYAALTTSAARGAVRDVSSVAR